MVTEEFKEQSKLLPFCRLWCVVEIAAALTFDVALVFKCSTTRNSDDGQTAHIVTGHGAVNLLINAAIMINVEAADAAVAEDKRRELAAIGAAKFEEINRTRGGSGCPSAFAVLGAPQQGPYTALGLIT